MPEITRANLLKLKESISFLTTVRAIKKEDILSLQQGTTPSQNPSIINPTEFIVADRRGAKPSESNTLTSVAQAANELINIIGTNGPDHLYQLNTLLQKERLGTIEESKLLRACLLAHAYGRSVPIEKRTEFRKAFTAMTSNDDLPVHYKIDPHGSSVAYEEVLKSIKDLHNLSTNYSHFHIASQRMGKNSPSMLENYITHVTGKGYYKSYSPATVINQETKVYGTADDFPGPGFIIQGIGVRASVFPKGYVEGLFKSGKPSSPKQEVEVYYRNLLMEGERELKDTVFTLFRGIIIIQSKNKNRMLIDSKKHALVVYNDHFQNPDQKIAFLIPDSLANVFTNDPLKYLNERTNFHPKQIGRYGPEIFDLFKTSVLSGFDKCFPFGAASPLFYKGSAFYDMWGVKHKRDLFYPERFYGHQETHDKFHSYNHRTHMFANIPGPTSEEKHPRYWSNGFDPRNLIPYKQAHDEVRNTVFYALSQLRLFCEGATLYNYGHEYNPKHKIWTHDKFRLLKSALNFHESERFKERRPILTGLEADGYSHFSEVKIKKGGFVDTEHMVWIKELDPNYKATPGKKPLEFDGRMLPGHLPSEEYDLRDEKTWKFFTGTSETKDWLDYLNLQETILGSQPVFFHPHMKPALLEIIKRKQEIKK